jgi:hypothetical protein
MTFGAEGVKGPETPRVGCARLKGEGGLDGTSRKPDATEVRSWAGSVPMAWRERWSRLRREGSVIRGRNRRVKEHRTKQRQEAPRVKGAWPCEDTLAACTMQGVTVIPL